MPPCCGSSGARDKISFAGQGLAPLISGGGSYPNAPAPIGAQFLHLSAHPSKLGSLPNAKTPTIVGAFVRGMRLPSAISCPPAGRLQVTPTGRFAASTFSFSSASASKLAPAPSMKMPRTLSGAGVACARDEIRTHTPFRALPPQSSASTNFATHASVKWTKF